MSAEQVTEDKIRINELKYQIKDLKIQLQFAHESNRSGRLEDELVEALASVERITNENVELEQTMKSLQNQLIQIESSKGVPSNSIGNLEDHIDLIHELSIMDDGSREKEMEQLYIKAKKDREKAVKLLLHLIGKDKITDYLDDNVGHHDLLERLYEGIMTKHIDLKDSKHTKKSSTPVTSPAGKADTSNDSILSQSPAAEDGKKAKVHEEEEDFVQVPHVPQRHKTTLKVGGKIAAGTGPSPKHSDAKNDKKITFKSGK